MDNFVCGLKVDDKLYQEYQSRKYKIEGKETALRGVEIMAASKEYQMYFPEIAKEAKQIVEQIKNEITQYYSSKDGRKEYAAMKHDTFGEYLKDLQEIHSKAAADRTRLKEKWDAAQKRWQDARSDSKSDEHHLTHEKAKYLDAQEEYKNSVRALQMRTQDEVEAVRNEFDKHVSDFYTANGNRIDDGTIRLLNSGIKLTDAEIESMVSQNRNNPTMLRLMSDYCEKAGIDNQSANFYGSLARKNGEKEKEAFRTVAEMIEKAVSEDEITSKIWSRPESHFKRLSDEQINTVNNLNIRPDALEASGE